MVRIKTFFKVKAKMVDGTTKYFATAVMKKYQLTNLMENFIKGGTVKSYKFIKEL